MNESFKTDPSLATSARAANESGSYLCASNVTPTAVRFIVSVFLCLLCSCRMSSTQMTCSHFWKNRPKKRQKPAGCRSRIISKNRPVPIFGRSTGASLVPTCTNASCIVIADRPARQQVNCLNFWTQRQGSYLSFWRMDHLWPLWALKEEFFWACIDADYTWQSLWHYDIKVWTPIEEAYVAIWDRAE